MPLLVTAKSKGFSAKMVCPAFTSLQCFAAIWNLSSEGVKGRVSGALWLLQTFA
jgi:hypothetical protein